MKKVLILFILICLGITFHSFCQNKEIESIKEQIEIAIYNNNNWNNALYFSEMLSKASQKEHGKNSFQYFSSIYSKGVIYQNLGYFNEGKEFLINAISSLEKDKKIRFTEKDDEQLTSDYFKIQVIENEVVAKSEIVTNDSEEIVLNVDVEGKLDTVKKESISKDSLTLGKELSTLTAGQIVDEVINTAKNEIKNLIKYLTEDSSKTVKEPESGFNKKADNKNLVKEPARNEIEIKKPLLDIDPVVEKNNMIAAFKALLGKVYALENETILADQSFSEAMSLLKFGEQYSEREIITLLRIMENDLSYQKYGAFEENKKKLPVSENFCLSDSIRLTQFTAQFTKLLADYYYTIKDQKKALSIYNLAIDRYENLYGFHIDLPGLYMKVAEMQVNQNQIDEALRNLEHCRRLVAQKIGKLNPEYAKLISVYAEVKDRLGLTDNDRISEIGALHKSAINTINRLLGSSNINYSLAYMRMANHSALYPNDSATLVDESLLLKMLQNIETYYGPEHIETIKTYSVLTKYYFQKNDLLKSNGYFEQVSEKLKQKITQQIGFLNENELNSIITFLKLELRALQSMALAKQEDFPSLSANIFESDILLKGLLLSSSKLLQSSDPAIKSQQDKLFRIKNELAKVYTLNFSASVIKADSLEIELRKVEKELFVTSKGAVTFKFDATIENIQQGLGPKDILLDIVLLPNAKKGDGEYYACIVDKSGPLKLVKLCEESVLHEFIIQNYQGIGSDSLTFSKMYGNRGFKSKTVQASTTISSYDLIIKPIEKFILNKSKVYISPDGEFNNISFNAISKNGVYLIEKHEFIHILNPKTLINIENVSFHKTDKLLLIGDVDFGENGFGDARGMKKIDQGNSPAKVDNSYFSTYSWPSLIGTKVEIQKISTLFKNYDVQRISGTTATEEYFKGLNANSPEFLHAATHGFAMKRDTLSKLPFFYSENPMLRSGLILHNANRFWTTGTAEMGREDGILTSYEVANLDLRKTKLASLSACQTALGDIGSDGVYGLQRAFKMAGAKQLLVSLWEVSDLGTQMLMTEFYANLSAGKNTREAFRVAQLKLKSNPKASPFWWSAFILVE